MIFKIEIKRRFYLESECWKRRKERRRRERKGKERVWVFEILVILRFNWGKGVSK